MPRPATLAEWGDIRRATLSFVQQTRRARHPGLSLRPIDRAAIDATAHWASRRNPHWKWQAIAASYGRNRIEVAIWSGGRLCGLAIGNAARERVELDRIEGDPDRHHPLRGHIVDLAIACAEVLAVAIEAEQVWINSPASGLSAWYASKGYSKMVRRGYEIDHLYKDMLERR